MHIKHSFNSRIVHRRLDFSFILKSEKKQKHCLKSLNLCLLFQQPDYRSTQRSLDPFPLSCSKIHFSPLHTMNQTTESTVLTGIQKCWVGNRSPEMQRKGRRPYYNTDKPASHYLCQIDKIHYLHTYINRC